MYKPDKHARPFIKSKLDELNSLKLERNIGNLPMYDLEQYENTEIQIRIDENIAPAKFLPDPQQTHIWYANALTFRAMKKDIFLAGHSENFLERPTQCLSCHQKLDGIFWNFCPYCEGKLVEV